MELPASICMTVSSSPLPWMRTPTRPEELGERALVVLTTVEFTAWPVTVLCEPWGQTATFSTAECITHHSAEAFWYLSGQRRVWLRPQQMAEHTLSEGRIR